MILEINEEQRMILRDLLEEEIRYLKEDAIPSSLDMDKESLKEEVFSNETDMNKEAIDLFSDEYLDRINRISLPNTKVRVYIF